jgi:predicted transcriptional regulator
MIDVSLFTAYNLIIGLVTGIGIIYFLLFKQTVIEYRGFLFMTITGLMLFLVGGPLVEVVYPEFVHWVHGIAAVLVILGLYNPVQNDSRHDLWTEILLKDPTQVRRASEWMLPVDDAVLSLFHATDLILTPSIVAYNIDYSRDEVNRRLTELEQRGFVEKVERGKYRITALGKQYIEGPASSDLRNHLQYLRQAHSKR